MSVDTGLSVPSGDIQKLLRDVIAIALAGRRMVVGTAFLTAVLAVLMLRMIEPSFTATLIVGPTAAEGLLGRGTPVSGLPMGALVDGAVHGASEKMSYYERFLYELNSLTVANELAASPEIMQSVFKAMWDPRAQVWVPDPGLAPRLRRMLSDLVGRPSWSAPDGRDFASYLRNKIQVQQIGNTPFRRITYRHSDPDFARMLLNRLYAATERQLKAMAVSGNSRMIDEYERMIRVTPDMEHRLALRATLIGHERFAMMMNVDFSLAADLMQPAMTEAVPDTPDPAMVLPIAAAAGLVFGLVLVFLRAVPDVPSRLILFR